MLYLTIALGLVAAVSGEDSLKPILAVQLSNLKFLAGNMERMINDSAILQLRTVVETELNCWDQQASEYIQMVDDAAAQSSLVRLKSDAQYQLGNVETMDDAQLKKFEEYFYQNDNSVLKTIPPAVKKYNEMVSKFVQALNVVNKVECKF